MTVMRRTASITTTGVLGLGSAWAAWTQASAGKPLSDPTVFIGGLGALAGGVATALQVWQAFGAPPATTRDVDRLGDRIARNSAASNAALEAKVDRLLAMAEGGSRGSGLALDAAVRDQFSAIVESEDPDVQAAINRAIANPGPRSREATERALIAAAENGKLTAAARLRELGAFQSLYSVAKAINSYRQALRLDPTDFWTHVLLHRLLSSENNPEAYDVANACLALAPENTRERSIACNELGDAFRARNDPDGALGCYEEGLEIARELSRSDPDDVNWARDVSVSLNKVGDIFRGRGDFERALKCYEEGLEIRRRLLVSNSESQDLKRDIAVSISKIADIMRVRDEFEEALVRYQEGLEISRELLESDPTDGERRRDVAVVLERIGIVQLALEERVAARETWEEELALAQALANEDPSNLERRRFLAVTHLMLASLEENDAKTHLNSARDLLRALSEAGRLAPKDADLLAHVEELAAAAGIA